ncbi:piggyBac transposable element-derived protein 3-like, partial [Bactrocera tryoni]|uniref:piggyBac transposable element-derived protein 3-like n=1 Tax=Bactrocera tryoni TaxID=59916 RepID=UPI001A96982B
MTDKEDLDDDRINLNDNNDNFLNEIAGHVELQYSLEGENIQDVGNELSETENPSTSNAHGDVMITGGFKRKSDFDVLVWRKPRNFEYSRTPINIEAFKMEEIFSEIGSKSPYDIFSLYFDKLIIAEITHFTNEYANQHNTAINVTPVEIRRFISILYISGYHTLPHIDHYWSVRPDMGIPIVKQALSRNRLKIIKRFLHLADNTDLNTVDRFAKVRPLIDALNKKFMQFGVFSHILSVDEQMIPYFGRHSCKMFIKGKPIRFGFKSWCLCSESGYLFSSILYGGAATPHDKNVGLGAQTVLDLLAN